MCHGANKRQKDWKLETVKLGTVKLWTVKLETVKTGL